MRFSPLRLLLLSTIAFACLGAVHLIRSQPPSHHPATHSSHIVRRALAKEALKRDHFFISANHPRLSYNGRWIPILHPPRRDTSFVGASLEFGLANVTSAYLQLRNDNGQQKPKQTYPTDLEENTRKLVILPGGDEMPPSAPVSLRVEFGDRALHFNGNAYGLIALFDDKDNSNNISHQPLDTAAVRVLLAAAPPGTTLEFEGLWLNHGAHLQSPPRHHDPSSSRRRALIETITSSSPHTSTLLDSYTSLLASSFNFSHHHHNHLHLPYCLTSATCPPSQPTIHNVYFRSGLPFTSHFPLPYHFPPPPPSVLILELGLQDYSQFLFSASSSSTTPPPSTHSITQFNQRFIQAYAALIKSIRAYGYPPHVSSSTFDDIPLLHYQDQNQDQEAAHTDTLNPDAIWLYNSAPSTLPIVLLTPFTPHKTLRRLLSHALAEVVQRVRHDHGDTSTFWLDTTGWVDSHDFRHHNDHDHDNDNGEQQQQQVAVLTAEAHVKIAGLLGAELCAHLAPEATGDGGEGEACPFRSAGVAPAPAPYTGNVVVPEVRDMGVLLEERKVNLLRGLIN